MHERFSGKTLLYVKTENFLRRISEIRDSAYKNSDFYPKYGA